MDRSRYMDDIRAAEKQNLKKFLLDVVDYCLGIVGLRWPTPEDDGLYQREYFKNHMGDTVLRYRNAHDEQFRTYIRKEQPLNDIDEFVYLFMEVHFKNNSRKMAADLFFGFCAFLVDTAIFCCRYERPDLVVHALESAAQVYDLFLGEYGDEFWTEFKTLVEEMWRAYENAHNREARVEEECDDCLETSLSSSSESITDDLVACFERELQARQENLDRKRYTLGSPTTKKD